MALPLAIPIAMGAASLAGGIFGAKSNEKINKQTEAFQREMWEKQRDQDLANWHMANEYNHPSKVMERLKAANLNPYMVYGDQSSWSGGSPSAPGAPSASPLNLKPVNYGSAVGDGLSSYFNTKLQSAQIDNVKAQTQATAAQTIKTLTDADTGKFDLGMKHDLRETSLDVAKWSLEKLQNETTNAATEGTLKVGALDLQKADLGLKQLQGREAKARIENLRRSGALQDFEIQMRKSGVTQSDPLWARALVRFLKRFGISIDEL